MHLSMWPTKPQFPIDELEDPHLTSDYIKVY